MTLSFYKRWSRLALWNKISFLGALSSIIGILLSFVIIIVIRSPVSREINAKIRELDDIKQALTTLSSYVDGQQRQLKKLSSQKIELEQERDRIQKVLQIDKDKLDALLEYQATQENRRVWLQITISFFVGVLSSSIVTFMAMSIQARKKTKKRNEAEQVA